MARRLMRSAAAAVALGVNAGGDSSANDYLSRGNEGILARETRGSPERQPFADIVNRDGHGDHDEGGEHEIRECRQGNALHNFGIVLQAMARSHTAGDRPSFARPECPEGRFVAGSAMRCARSRVQVSPKAAVFAAGRSDLDRSISLCGEML